MHKAASTPIRRRRRPAQCFTSRPRCCKRASLFRHRGLNAVAKPQQASKAVPRAHPQPGANATAWATPDSSPPVVELEDVSRRVGECLGFRKRALYGHVTDVFALKHCSAASPLSPQCSSRAMASSHRLRCGGLAHGGCSQPPLRFVGQALRCSCVVNAGRSPTQSIQRTPEPSPTSPAAATPTAWAGRRTRRNPLSSLRTCPDRRRVLRTPADRARVEDKARRW